MWVFFFFCLLVFKVLGFQNIAFLCFFFFVELELLLNVVLNWFCRVDLHLEYVFVVGSSSKGWLQFWSMPKKCNAWKQGSQGPNLLENWNHHSRFSFSGLESPLFYLAVIYLFVEVYLFFRRVCVHSFLCFFIYSEFVSEIASGSVESWIQTQDVKSFFGLGIVVWIKSFLLVVWPYGVSLCGWRKFSLCECY